VCAGWFYDTYYHMAFGKSTDGGTTWTHSMISTSGATAYPYSLGLDPSHPDTIYVGGYEGSGSALYRTLDGGTSWTKLTTTIMTSYIYAVAVNPTNPSTIFAGTGGGIYRSTDFGANWVKVSTTIAGCKDVLIDPANPSRVWVGTSSQGVYQSTDGGTTWTAMNTGLGDMTVNKLAINPNSYLFAGTDGAAAYRWSLSVGVGDSETAPVALPALYASPNPVSAGASIHYSVVGSDPVSISIYDIQGRLVSTLSEGAQAPGDHETWWGACDDSGRTVTPGVYFIRLVSGGEVQTGRLVVAR
jgi:hypothetical protein